MIYEVSKDSADFLISMGRAVAAKGSEKVGKVYDTTKNTGGKKTGGKKPDDIID